MHFALSVLFPLLIFSFGDCAVVNDTQTKTGVPITIGVTNGQSWGVWGNPEKCPSGTYATGFSLKVQPYQGFWVDDTALNGIALHCSEPIGNNGIVGPFTTIKSSEGSWGSWTQNVWCPNGVLTAFQLQVESYQWLLDDSAATNIRFICTGNQVLEGSGMNWGYWGSWSTVCAENGICGIQTKVDSPNWQRDDTALNDVLFYCC
ncbi:vitelline membrane outer layer protein 1, partial [Silurus asotus]